MNTNFTCLNTKHLAIALLAIATISLMMPFPIFAQHNKTIEGDDRVLFPTRVFLFNDDAELEATTGETVVASLSYKFSQPHRLTIDFSSVGAVIPDSASDPAVLLIGCFVDGASCIGTQTNPPNTPPGWVIVLSCNFNLTQPSASPCVWDSVVSHVWFSQKLSGGTHTVEIKLAVGNPLIPFMGTGTAHNEARNLVVTLLSGLARPEIAAK